MRLFREQKCFDFIKDIRQENEWTLKLIVISTRHQATHSHRRKTIHTIFCQPNRVLFTEISRWQWLVKKISHHIHNGSICSEVITHSMWSFSFTIQKYVVCTRAHIPTQWYTHTIIMVYLLIWINNWVFYFFAYKIQRFKGFLQLILICFSGVENYFYCFLFQINR